MGEQMNNGHVRFNIEHLPAWFPCLVRLSTDAPIVLGACADADSGPPQEPTQPITQENTHGPR